MEAAKLQNARVSRGPRGRSAVSTRRTGRTDCAAHFTRAYLLICKESDASADSATDFLLTSTPRHTVLLWYFFSSILSSFGSSPARLLQPFNSEVCLIQCPARVKCRLDTKSAPPRLASRKDHLLHKLIVECSI